MNTNRLRHLFSRALTASLATPLVLAGCGNSADLVGYSNVACTNGQLSLSDLTLDPAPDYVALRLINGYDPANNPGYETKLSTGQACATATDVPACQTALQSARASDGFNGACVQVCSDYFLATTRGDEVKTWATLESLRELLGTIDTAQEAALMVFAAGYQVRCELLEQGAVRQNDDGSFDVVGTKGYACGEGNDLTQHVVRVSPSGDLQEKEDHVLVRGRDNCAVGRRPVGLQSSGVGACDDALGDHFARTAHLEAASIHAFLRLRDELALHGAGTALRDAALASAMDEVLHTELTGQLARRFGARPPPPAVEPVPPRSLGAVALDNAVEGCVRETFGALVAHHQALHARDGQVRRAMALIARDETRHAGLSWDIHQWASARLSSGEREALKQAQRRAVELLREEVCAPVDPALVTAAGLPTPEVALALLDTLEQELWA